VLGAEEHLSLLREVFDTMVGRLARVVPDLGGATASDAMMVVHAGLATLLAATPRREGTLGKMRLGPIAKALRKKLEA